MAAILNFRIFAQNGKTQFYYTTIAYHVGLNADLGWPQGIMANVLEKKTFIVGRVNRPTFSLAV